MKFRWLLLFSSLGISMIACGIAFQAPRFLRVAPDLPSGDIDSSVANGESIYFTARNLDGERISYRGGPSYGGMMMGSYLTCAACHGPEARGGTHIMHMQIMNAPDVRYSALSDELEEHGNEETHGDEHNEYDLEDFYGAVIKGEHPNGERLSRDMPRWQMSEEDLKNLFEFLKAIP